MTKEFKGKLDELAKKRGMRLTQMIIEILELSSEGHRPSLYEKDVEIADKIKDVIKSHGVFRPEGALVMDMKKQGVVLYTPDAWAIPLYDLLKLSGLPRSALHLVVSELGEYNLIDPDNKKHKFTGSLIKHTIKTLNLYSTGGVSSYAEATTKVFGKEVPDAVILSKKIDPLHLAKFCEKNPDKKVIYLLDVKEFKDFVRPETTQTRAA